MQRSLLLAFALLVGSILCHGSLAAQDTVIVKKALDHNTILVGKNEKITLIGIELPSTGAVTAKDARDRLDRHIKGKQVVLLRDPSLGSDSKKQKLRYVSLIGSGKLINLELIKEGYAAASRAPSHWKLGDFVAAEEEARKARLGAWVIDGTSMNTVTMNISPNPLSDVSMIHYRLPKSCRVTLSVLDGSGNEVAKLVDQNEVSGGHVAIFKRLDLKNGEYVCQLKAGATVVTQKLIIVSSTQ